MPHFLKNIQQPLRLPLTVQNTTCVDGCLGWLYVTLWWTGRYQSIHCLHLLVLDGSLWGQCLTSLTGAKSVLGFRCVGIGTHQKVGPRVLMFDISEKSQGNNIVCGCNRTESYESFLQGTVNKQQQKKLLCPFFSCMFISECISHNRGKLTRMHSSHVWMNESAIYDQFQSDVLCAECVLMCVCLAGQGDRRTFQKQKCFMKTSEQRVISL